jgi:glycosyltransferase involved in cell wall biosynthesis
MSDQHHPPRLRLVVPCYNEAERLEPDAFRQFAGEGVSFLFVDDASTDATPRILAELAASSRGRIEVVTLPRNAGKAVAVRTGVLAALERPCEFVGYWDSDLSTPLDAVHGFLAIADAHPRLDIVIGSRVKLLGRQIARHAWRHYIGRVFATGASVALGVGVYDTQCGAKLFRASEITRRVFDAPFRSAWVFDVEILARYIAEVGSREAESRVYELPLEIWRDVPGSKVKLWHAARAVWDLVWIGVARRAGRRP